MRPFTVAGAFVIAISTAACGPGRAPAVPDPLAAADAGAADANTPSGSGGVGADGGAAEDAGLSGVGGPDGGETDGGAAAGVCHGRVESLPAPKTYRIEYSLINSGYCGLPVADGQGNIALEVSEWTHPSWDLLDPGGTRIGKAAAWRGALFPAALGYITQQGHSGGANIAPDMQSIDRSGRQRTHTRVYGTPALVPSSRGEMLVLGPVSEVFVAPADAKQMVWQLRDDASSLWGPTPLALQSRVLGGGADADGRVLVIQDGAGRYGAGAIAAQWFGRDGTALTGAFELIAQFRSGPSTWFETSAIVGGLAIRRMDQETPSSLKTSEWLVVLRSGSQRPDPAPEWLRSRPNSDLVLAGDRYAMLPWGTYASPCAQAVEILSSSGTSCATLQMPVDSVRCLTRDLRRGLDGTLLQMLPVDREQSSIVGGAEVRTCTLRFWPAATAE